MVTLLVSSKYAAEEAKQAIDEILARWDQVPAIVTEIEAAFAYGDLPRELAEGVVCGRLEVQA